MSYDTDFLHVAFILSMKKTNSFRFGNIDPIRVRGGGKDILPLYDINIAREPR